jgi:hypothetical protein
MVIVAEHLDTLRFVKHSPSLERLYHYSAKPIPLARHS